jgi:hypothetical protein
VQETCPKVGINFNNAEIAKFSLALITGYLQGPVELALLKFSCTGLCHNISIKQCKNKIFDKKNHATFEKMSEDEIYKKCRDLIRILYT